MNIANLLCFGFETRNEAALELLHAYDEWTDDESNMFEIIVHVIHQAYVRNYNLKEFCEWFFLKLNSDVMRQVTHERYKTLLSAKLPDNVVELFINELWFFDVCKNWYVYDDCMYVGRRVTAKWCLH